LKATNVKNPETGFEEAVRDYLKTSKELDKKPKKTYKGVFNVRVPSSIRPEIYRLMARV